MSRRDTYLGGGFGAVVALMSVVRNVFGYGWDGVAVLLLDLNTPLNNFTPLSP